MEPECVDLTSTATTLDLDTPVSGDEPFVNQTGLGDRVIVRVVRPEKNEELES